MYAMHIPHADWRDPRPSQSPHKGQRKNGRAVASARICLLKGKGIVGFHLGAATYCQQMLVK